MGHDFGVRVAVVNVRKVRMPVHDRVVDMRVRVRFVAIPRESMDVAMVLVMPVRVRVLDCIVDVLVDVMFAQMQPETEPHE